MAVGDDSVDDAREPGQVPPPPPPPPPPLTATPEAPIPALTPLEADTQVVRRGSGRTRLALAAVVALAVLAGGLAFLVSRSDEVDPDRALAAAQSVVEESASFRFEALQVTNMKTGDPDGAGSDSTMRIVTTGEVAGPETWRLTEDYGTGFGSEPEVYEAIRIGDTIYTDGGTMMGDVPGPSWVAYPVDATEMTVDEIAEMYEDLESEDVPSDMEVYDDSFRLELVIEAYLLMSSGRPEDLTRLVTEATEPAIEEAREDGGVVLQARLAPVPEIAAVAEDPVPPVDLRIALDEDDRPVLVRFTASAGDASADFEVAFSDWGAAIEIEPPADEDIDQTPWLQEEALAEVDPALRLLPANVPAGMVLSSASVWADDPETGTCESVELGYSAESERELWGAAEEPTTDELDEFYADADYLSLSVSSLSCAMEMDDTPFDEEFGGLPARGDSGWREVKVGDAVVYVDSSFDDDVTGAILASLRPVAVADVSAAIPQWVQELTMSSGFVG